MAASVILSLSGKSWTAKVAKNGAKVAKKNFESQARNTANKADADRPGGPGAACQPTAGMAQSCALCYTQAASAGTRMIQALKSGILILIVPPTLASIGMIFIMYRKRNQLPRSSRRGGLRSDLEQTRSLELQRQPHGSTRAITESCAGNALSVEAPGLLHADQTRGQPADPDDHFGRLLSGLSGPFRLGRLFITLAGTLLVASGTATLNQWMETRS